MAVPVMRIESDGVGRCTVCKQRVFWVKAGSGWAGVVDSTYVKETLTEPYAGQKSTSRVVAIALHPGARQHSCHPLITDKYASRFAAFVSGQKLPTPPKDETPKVKDEPKVTPKDELPKEEHMKDGSNPFQGLMTYIDERITTLASNSIDVDKVNAIVAEAIGQLPKPGEKIVERIVVLKDGERHESKAKHVHPSYVHVATCASAGIPVWMPGPPGAGKSHLGRQLADDFGVDYYELVLSPADTPGKISGFFAVDGKTVVSTEFRKAWISGGVIHIEEVANGNPAALVTLNSALANGHCTFPDGTYPKHSKCFVIASDNTWGIGGNPMFPTRRPVDGAFRDRFAFVLIDYVDSFEDAIALDKAKGNEQISKPWVAWVRSVREWAKANAPTMIVTPRASFNGVAALLCCPKDTAPNVWLEFVADAIVLKLEDRAMRQRILSACPLPKVQL